MKKIILFFTAALISITSFSQNDFRRLIEEGIELHDKGDYEEAIKKYDSVISQDKNHYLANYEKSYTLMILKKYDECIVLCKFLLEQAPQNQNSKSVYVNWGSALDDKGDAAEALKIYDMGIGLYPDFYLLYFNKGITLVQTNRIEEGLLFLQQALTKKPLHAGSHQFIGRILKASNRIPSFLAFFTFLLIEPESERAKANYDDMNKLIMKGISDNPNGKGTTISIDAAMLDKKNKKKEDDFSSVDMMFSLTSALDKDEKFKDQNEAEKLDRKVQLLAGMLNEQKKNGKGFYWKFYTPFFCDLKESNYLLTACYIATLNSGDAAVGKWLNDNKDKVSDFYSWLKDYKWYTGK